MDRPVRVGVVGVGIWAISTRLIYSRLDGAELVGVADTDAARAERWRREAGCAAFAEPRALLGQGGRRERGGAHHHAPGRRRPYLAAGVHMLLEKPVAPDMAQGREILRLAEASGRAAADRPPGALQRRHHGAGGAHRPAALHRGPAHGRLQGACDGRGRGLGPDDPRHRHHPGAGGRGADRGPRRGHAGADRARGHRQRALGVRRRRRGQHRREPRLGSAHPAHPRLSRPAATCRWTSSARRWTSPARARPASRARRSSASASR
jgi:hypothetical protein